MKTRPTFLMLWPSAVLPTFITLLLSPIPTSSTPLNASISLPAVLQNGPHCTNNIDWILPTFERADCLEAIEAFTYGDYLRHGTTRFEFRNRHTSQRTRPRLPPMRTPRRYTIGKCTIAVAILEDYWPLPGVPRGDYERTDVASFREIFESVRRISLSCLDSAEQCGWEAVGREGSVGVFIYATNSPVDLYIELASDVGVLRGLGGGTQGGNGSTS